MAILLTLTADDWFLEITGPLVRLPEFLPNPISTYKTSGNAQLNLYSAPVGGLVAAEQGSISSEALFFENTTYDFYLRCRNPNCRLELPSAVVREHRTGDVTHQSINFGNDVGFSEIHVRGKRDVSLSFEVFPAKVDYRRDYVRMREDVSRTIRNLAMAVQTRTFAFASPFASADRTLNEWVELLRHYFKELMKAGELIARSSHSALVTSSEMVPIEKSRHLDRRRFDRTTRARSRRGLDGDATGLRYPKLVPELKRRTSFDTPENRYIKYLLLRTAHNLRSIINTHDSGDEDADLTAEERFFQAFRQHARGMLQRLQRLLSEDFLRGIRPEISDVASSLVLLKHPTYARFIKLARLFNGGLTIDSQVLRVGIKNIALLYEYWCFLSLVQRLSQGFDLEQQSLVRQRHTGVVVTLAKGVQVGVQFRDRKTGKMLSLVYDRAFRDLPTIAQRPDNIIQLASDRRLHILDAKYRLAYDDEYCARYGGVGPVPEDINAMHRYRDAIVTAEPLDSNTFARVIVSATVLFPYTDQNRYTLHRFHKSLAQVRIGGIPFLPGVTDLLDKHLRAILADEGYAETAHD